MKLNTKNKDFKGKDEKMNATIGASNVTICAIDL